MHMMQKAMPQWRENELYRPYYHEVGMLRADRSSFGQESIDAYKALGSPNKSCFLPVEEVRNRWNGAFATAEFGDLSHVLYNPSVGFAEADKALGAVVQAAIDLGVDFQIGEMACLAFNSAGQCTGVELKSGRELRADKILMATGARTSALLVQSAPKNKDLHAGKRLVATGAVSFKAKLHGAQKDKFAPIPVLKNCLPQVKGMCR
jgi:sarcosine oxidase/L-pipecolate oxidase